MAGADVPATLSGFCHPMAIAMVKGLSSSIQGFEGVIQSRSRFRDGHGFDVQIGGRPFGGDSSRPSQLSSDNEDGDRCG